MRTVKASAERNTSRTTAATGPRVSGMSNSENRSDTNELVMFLIHKVEHGQAIINIHT